MKHNLSQSSSASCSRGFPSHPLGARAGNFPWGCSLRPFTLNMVKATPLRSTAWKLRGSARRPPPQVHTAKRCPTIQALHGSASADVFGRVYSPSQGPLPCFLGVIRSLATDSQSTFLTHDSSCKNKNTVTHQACRMSWPISGWAVQPCQTAQCHIPTPKTWSSLSSLSPPLPFESQNSISCMTSWGLS